MKTTTKKRILIIGITAAIIATVIGFAKGRQNTYGELLSVSFYIGSFHDGYTTYRVEKRGDEVFFEAENKTLELDIYEKVNQDILDDLNTIIHENNIIAWRDYKGSDDEVSDGHSFGFTAIYKIGKIEASGWYNMHPKEYKEGVLALKDYFERLLAGL